MTGPDDEERITARPIAGGSAREYPELTPNRRTRLAPHDHPRP